MKNTAEREHKYNIRAGLPILGSAYGLTIDETDYLELALNELRDISNFSLLPMITYVMVDSEGYFDIPCNMDIIEGLGVPDVMEKNFKNRIVIDPRQTESGNFQTALMVRNSLAWSTRYLNSVPGFIDYLIEGDKVRILDSSFAGQELALAFSGYEVDEEGFPIITRKQAKALGALAARNVVMKGAFKGDKAKAAMLEFIMKESSRLKQAAGIPENISDNDIDDIMDIQTSFNRKKYKRPNKYSR